jgi:hypothetical protein
MKKSMSSTITVVLRRVRQYRVLLAGPPQGFGRIRPSAEIQAESGWTADPFDVAQGRGEHSRTTIKTFGGDGFGVASPRPSRNFQEEKGNKKAGYRLPFSNFARLKVKEASTYNPLPAYKPDGSSSRCCRRLRCRRRGDG